MRTSSRKPWCLLLVAALFTLFIPLAAALGVESNSSRPHATPQMIEPGQPHQGGQFDQPLNRVGSAETSPEISPTEPLPLSLQPLSHIPLSGPASQGQATLDKAIVADLNREGVLLQDHSTQYLVEESYEHRTGLASGSASESMNYPGEGDVHAVQSIKEVRLRVRHAPWQAALGTGEALSLDTSLGTAWDPAYLIPSYSQDHYPELNNVDHLKQQRYKDLFATAERDGGARWISCVTGQSCALDNDSQVEGAGLADQVQAVLPASYSTLDTSLDDAHAGQDSWVAYPWNTKEAFLLPELLLLAEPEYSDECWRTTEACAYEDSTPPIGVIADLQDSAPEVSAFLTRGEFNADVQLKSLFGWKAENRDAAANIRASLQPQQSLATDREALVALYNATDGDNWVNNTNWLSDLPVDQWYGVTTFIGRVYWLRLADNGLAGPIPPELGDLTNLDILDLGNRAPHCHPTSGCPPNWPSANRLTGEIPSELGNLSSLRVLNLWGNQLTGPIPEWLGSLTNLTSIYLSANKGLTGSIPSDLGGLTNLSVLYLGGTDLSGEIPSELGNLTNLEHLRLDLADLSGEIPSELGNLTNLVSLHLQDNRLSGEIPAKLGNLTNLVILDLHDNQLSGVIPAELVNLHILAHMYLAGNQFSGCVPAVLQYVRYNDLDNLGLPFCAEGTDRQTDRAALVAFYNATDGDNWANNANWLSDAPLGDWYGVDTVDGRVTGLMLEENRLRGTIPAGLGNLANLKVLNIGNVDALCDSSGCRANSPSANQLSGEVPAELGNLLNLQVLGLNLTGLSGEIPVELGNLSNLFSLVLGGNQLSGEIPAELGNLTSLRVLNLWANQLSGEIPAELGNLSHLTGLYLSENQFSGCVPKDLQDVPDNDLNDLGLPFCGDDLPAPDCDETLTGDGSVTGEWAEGCQSEVSGRGYARYFTFVVTQESQVTITLERTSGNADTYLYLREGTARSGTALFENDDHDGITVSQVQGTLDAGNYTIEATTYGEGQTGAFTLTLEGLEGSSPTPTNCVEDLGTLTEAVNQFGTWAEDCASSNRDGSYARFYSFSLSQETEVNILVSSSWDTYLYLLEGAGTDGRTLYENDDVESGDTDAGISVTLGSGSYTVEATTFRGGITGGFNLRIEPEDATTPTPTPGGCVQTLGPLAAAANRNGSWTGECDSANRDGSYARFYGFSLDAETEVQIDLTSTADTFLYLLEGAGTNGGVLDENDDAEGGITNSRINITLQPGQYTVEATTFHAATTGDFTLEVVPGVLGEPPPSDCVLALSGDGTINGEWAAGCDSEVSGRGYARYYTFTVEQRSQVTITLESSAADTYLYLREGTSKSGAYLQENDDYEGTTKSLIQAELEAGEYTIEATTFGAGEAGDFTLTVEGLGGGAGPPPSECIQAVTGDGTVNGTWAAGCDSEVSGRGYARYYTFTVDQESQVTITLESSEADTYLYLREGSSKSGGFLYENDDYEGITKSLIQADLEAGEYTIEATTFGAGETGSFTLTVEGLRGMAGSLESDRAALVAFYNATDGNNWTNNENWLSGEAIRQWHGVSGDSEGRARVLALSSNGLDGSIPAMLGNLDRLERLFLTSNQLGGAIPAELGHLSNLEVLHLNSNQLNGTIPAALGNLTGLTSLRLNTNQLTGEIPAALGGLDNLEVLRLSGNQLTGCVPEGLRDVPDNDLDQLGLPFCDETPTPPTSDCVGTITGDGTVNGTWAAGCDSEVSGRGYARYYTFTVDQETQVTITLESSDADTYLYLREGTSRSGAHLQENDDYEGITKSLIQADLEAGEYTIEATTFGAGETGSFTLTVAGLGGGVALPPSDCVGTITGDGTVNGTWAAGCDSEVSGRGYARYYTFTVDQETQVTITLESSDADTYLYLREGTSRSGAHLQENDDYEGITKSLIQADLEAGEYTIEATTFGAGETGSFTLTVAGLGGGVALPPSDCVGTITGDGTVNGTWAAGCDSEVSGRGYARYYTFTVDQETQVTITLESSDADTYLYLREGTARSGAALFENDDHDGITVSQVQGTLAAGSYTIEATTFGAGETGSFTLTIAGVGSAPPGTGGECVEALGPLGITPGRVSVGRLGETWTSDCESANRDGRYALFYSFTLQTRGEVTITLESRDVDPYLYLLQGEGKDGRVEAENDDHEGSTSTSQIQVSLEAGSYTIEATTFAVGQTGAFDLTVIEPATLSPQGAALVALYGATDGDNWANNENWGDAGKRLGDWYGVTTDEQGQVIALDLMNNGLTGELPAGAELSALTHLQSLNLSYNQLTGTIPAQWGSLENPSFPILAHLDLSGNRLSGPIPEDLGNQHLTLLYLHDNQLTGPIPPRWGEASALDGGLPSLRALNLNGNRLEGEVPVQLGSLSRLEALQLRNNLLHGRIPDQLGNLTNLEALDLGYNRLSGEIPVGLGNLSSLKWLLLSGQNPFKGQEFTSPALIERILNDDLYWLSGPIPSELGGLSNLEVLDLSNNRLGGPIPTRLGNLNRLRALNLKGNRLTSQVPLSLGKLENLLTLDLSNNRLDGSIPGEVGGLDSLENLTLSNNSLEGSIPASLVTPASSLIILDLHSNLLEGAVPEELGAAANLEALDLRHNLLSGAIPVALGDLANLRELWLYGNDFGNETTSSPRVRTSDDTTPQQAHDQAGDGNCVPSELLEVPDNDLERLDLPPCTDSVTDRRSLWAFYGAVGGDQWTVGSLGTDGEWNLARPINTWYGVTTDGNGRVTKVELPDNNLGRHPTGDLLPAERIRNGLINLSRLSELQVLNLSENAFRGEIPSALGNLAELQALFLYGNRMSGWIPDELGDLSNLLSLDLSDNNLISTIPSTLAQITDLQRLQLAGNPLGGCIPDVLLDVPDNDLDMLVGVLPCDDPLAQEVITLRAIYDRTSGHSWKQGKAGTKNGWFSDNLAKWHGVKVGSQGICEGRVVKLNLSGNGLDGSFLRDLGDLDCLLELDLSKNALSGSIPKALGNLTYLKILNLSENDFTGSIPTELGNLTNLETLDLSRNKTRQYTRLDFDLLHYVNGLEGFIPEELANLTKLSRLDLSGNKLQGGIENALPHSEDQPALHLSLNDNEWLGLEAPFWNKFDQLIKGVELGRLVDGGAPVSLYGQGARSASTLAYISEKTSAQTFLLLSVDVVGATVPQASKPVAAFNAARFAITLGKEGSLPVPGSFGTLLGWGSITAQTLEIIVVHTANSILGSWEADLLERNCKHYWAIEGVYQKNSDVDPEDCGILRSLNEF